MTSVNAVAGWTCHRCREHAGGLPVPAKEQPFLDFLDAMEKAEAEHHVVGNLVNMSATSPAAALGYLARRFPDRWHEKQALEISGKEGAPVALSHTLAAIPLTELQAEIAAIEAGATEDQED